MPLSNDIISEFAKLVNNKSSDKPATTQTLTGTIVVSDGKKWVQLDGSENLTPIESTDERGNTITQSITEIGDSDRVTVEIKDHTATVTGNLSNPSASTSTTNSIAGNVSANTDKISNFGTVLANNITTEYIAATKGTFEEIKANVGNFKDLTAENIEAIIIKVNELETKYAEIGNLTADKISSLEIDTEKLYADIANLGILNTDQLTAINASINQLQAYNGNFTYITAEVIKAVKASINKLNVDKLEANWANIDYANIDIAKLGEFFAKSGIIENISVSDISVTGDLVGVTITGSLIKGGTIAADKLMILGEDGLYHRLNATSRVIDEEVYTKTSEILGYTTEGMPNWVGISIGATTATGEEVYSYRNADDEYVYYCIVEETVYAVDCSLNEVEQEATDYNSLNGRIIAANSITADKISVSDLLAFAATIGGFKIDTDSIHTFSKNEVNNTTRGIYLDNDGQFAMGDSNNYIKFHRIDTYYKLVSFFSEPTSVEISEDISLWHIKHTDLYTNSGYEKCIAYPPGVYKKKSECGSVLDVIELDVRTEEGYAVYVDTYSSFYRCKDDNGIWYAVQVDPSIEGVTSKISARFAELKTEYKLDISADSVTFTDSDIDRLREISTHIKMGSYTDPDTNDTDPCLELFEDESTDVQRQTNKRSAFIRDNEEKVSVGIDGVTHYVNTDEHNGKYVWATRPNGNFGLIWKDVSD